MTGFPKLTLVIGGAASGKSRFAEGLVRQAGASKVYIATAQAFDGEMSAKIARHKDDRGVDWRTVEAPLDVVAALGSVAGDEVALLDCATLWLSNHLLAQSDPAAAGERLLAALRSTSGPVIVVSNEVGASIVPENALARAFCREQGRLNQRLATEADLVVTVIAGLPMVLKGQLP